MANEFYDPSANRSAKVRQLFNRIAPRYDLINSLQSFGLHHAWKRRLVGLARVRPGRHALDVCCGTGDISFALAKAGATTIGVDFSEGMLEVAERRQSRLPRESRERVSFVRGDANALPFANASFDVVTVGYGLRNLASWQEGLAEMTRVARPGGRLLVLDFGKPDNALWRGLYFAYLRMFVPILGKVFCGSSSAYAYILESLQHYPAQHGVAARMADLNLEEVQIINLLGGVMAINLAQVP